MFSGLYDMGEKMGENTCTHCFSGGHDIRLWGQIKQKTVDLQPTHAYILHIDHTVSKMYIYFFFLIQDIGLKEQTPLFQATLSESKYSHSEC